MSRICRLLAAVLLSAALAGGCATAGGRMADRFDLSGARTEESVREQLEAKLPLGSSRATVMRFVDGSGVRDATGCTVYVRDGNNDPSAQQTVSILCRFDSEGLFIALEVWMVSFRLDANGELEAIDARQHWIAL